MKIKIITDTSADLPIEYRKLYDIEVVPFLITLGEEEFLDEISIKPEDIYQFVEKKKILPKTAARSVGTYTEVFEKYSKTYDAVIYITISNKLSSAYQYSSLAAQVFDNVYVIDGQQLSSSTGLLVLYACEMVKNGVDAKTICERINAVKHQAITTFIIDKLDYLHKGGRCSGIASFIGARFNIKPTICMPNGKLTPGKKYLGNIKRTALIYAKDILKKYNTPDLKRVFITHTEIDMDVVEKIKAIVLETYPFEEVIIATAGSTITSHCGKGTIGVLYINNNELKYGLD